jgi:predicted RNase H-like nuclease (RuvC/YqgF family)
MTTPLEIEELTNRLRLRTMQEQEPNRHGGWDTITFPDPDCEKAADAIATLREKNARLRAQNEALDSELLSLEDESCHADNEIKAYCKEIDTLRNELDSRLTENARLQELLNLYREAVQVDVKMSGPEFMGVNGSALWRAWLQDEYRSATKETTIDNTPSNP